MRVCVIGSGLAGSLLAWRLRRLSPSVTVDLIVHSPLVDATAASGGGVRAYEPDPLVRAYAIESLVELAGSETLRQWCGYRRIGSTYLRTLWLDAPHDVAVINAALPGSARLADAIELKGLGWAGLDVDVVGVLEAEAGHIATDALRRALLAELSADVRVRVENGPALPLPSSDDRAPRCRVGGEIRAYDRVVIATGAWTPALLASLGIRDEACGNVKAIQYGLHPASGTLPTFFVDETSGLYGRPVDAHTMLLGVPVSTYGGPADGGTPSSALIQRVTDLVAARLPHLRVLPPSRVVRSADCYRPPHTLSLQAIDGHPGVLTFTGGSGGAAKTSLAASRHAAAQLISDSAVPRPPDDAHTPDASADSPGTLYERVES